MSECSVRLLVSPAERRATPTKARNNSNGIPFHLKMYILRVTTDPLMEQLYTIFAILIAGMSLAMAIISLSISITRPSRADMLFALMGLLLTIFFLTPPVGFILHDVAPSFVDPGQENFYFLLFRNCTLVYSRLHRRSTKRVWRGSRLHWRSLPIG